MNDEGWDGMERREVKRRYTVDRRTVERRKKYLFSVIMPTLLGILGAGVVSWGAYVTHATYSITAKYEQGYVTYIDKQAEVDRAQDLEIKRIARDYNQKVIQLHDDMNAGFKEIRDTQQNIFGLLLHRNKRGEILDNEDKQERD